MQIFNVARNIHLGIKSLMLHKLRSLLTMLGIVFGVSSVIAMLSIGEGASKEALEQIRKLGSTNILISTIKPVEDEAVANVQSHMSIYGLLYDDEQRIIEVPRSKLPQDVTLGEIVTAQHPTGAQVHMMVIDVNDESVRLDGNHPLAGKVLQFEVKILKVEAATEDEIEHGHVH